ncbi:MAG: glycerol-3-phosphate ABC transporter ATP-binding protein [Thermoprotei archaeon]|nr:MAG: glycerol-3-phosphate ABC transporter ATP-binding protein [Thermoprotei archaeon]
MAEVVLEHVTKRFGDVVAVKDVSLTIADGSFTVLLGPSGCGKTTTLRLIAGLEEVTAGRIFIGGRDVTRLEPKDRNVAMVFQNYALYPHLKVYDNIAFGLKAAKRPRSEIDRKVREAARLLGIEDLLNRRPRQLSGGQQQRVAIGRAIVRNPNVFLFDEPLSNLDAKLRIQMRTELLRLHRRLKTTTIYVTHDQEEAMTLGDTVVVMKEGEIMQIGTPWEIYNRPRNIFVAGFIGSPEMNFLHGTYQRGVFTLKCGVELGLGLFEVPEGEAILGVRPDDVYLAGHGPPDRSDPLSAVVDVIEFLGSRAIVSISLGEDRLRMVVSDALVGSLEEGKECRVVFDRRKLHLFDPRTGERLN